MDVDSNRDGDVISPISIQSSITVSMHPLVILNISEHWTRAKMEKESSDIIVYGALLGKTQSRHLEVVNSFELILDRIHDTEDTSQKSFKLDRDFFATREGQCKQVYPDLDFIGWYTTGSAADSDDHIINKHFQEITESPLLVKLDPHQRAGDRLPLYVYESVVDSEANVLFKEVPYTLATEDAERIGVDHVARFSVADNSCSTSLASEQLQAHYQAIQMLHSRLRLLRDYVKAVESGELPRDHSLLREIRALMCRLPVVSGVQFSSNLYKQCNDVCITAILSSLTQGLHTLYNYLQKQDFVSDKKGSRIRGRELTL